MLKKGLKKINKVVATMLSLVLLLGITSPIKAKAATITGQDVVNEAYKYLERPYVWGATGPNSFDCSGFTQYVYSQLGISIPRVINTYTNSQRGVGTKISSIDDLKPGDLVITYNCDHVGIYVGNRQYINAQGDDKWNTPGLAYKVVVSNINGFVEGRRVPGVVNAQDGWILSNGKWYWYENGVMFKNNWKQIDGKWYLFQEDGTMFANNWKNVNGSWYLFEENGAMVSNRLRQVNGKWYYFQENGVMFTNNWKAIDGKWYCFSENGDALIGWKDISSKRYYFYSNGQMAVNTIIDGCKIDSNGVATKL